MTNKKRFESFRREAEKNARNNETNICLYLSGSKNKRTFFEKMTEKYEEDSKLDFDLGINPTRELEEKAYKIMKQSIERFELY